MPLGLFDLERRHTFELQEKGDVELVMDNWYEQTAKLGQGLEAFPGEVVQFMKALGLETFNIIVLRTPVDTGNARSGWKIRTEGTGEETRIIISNSVFYIVFLEYGSSAQAPEGMVRVTANEMRQIIASWGPDLMDMIRRIFAR